MALLHYLWSRTAASNATADSNVNWAEGMAPSAVNDSARAMMASAAGFRDDIAGAIVTGGTTSAYTITSYQVFDTLAHMSGQVVAFTPNATNANTVGNDITLSVDGLTAKPIRMQSGAPLPSGSLIAGTPYLALYNNSDGAFYLHNMTNPYNIPIACGMDYWGPTTPNSSFVFPIGQAISRATYSSLFSGNPWSIGTTYGTGDGSTTFNLPDKTGRVSAMKEASATRLTSSYFGASGAILGSAGGGESQTLTLAQLPGGITSAVPGQTVNSTSSQTNVASGYSHNDGSLPNSGPFYVPYSTGPLPLSQITSTGTVSAVTATSNNTGGGAHPNVQPTIVCNYIMRII